MGVFKCNGGYIVDSTRLQGLAIANADGESEGNKKYIGPPVVQIYCPAVVLCVC